MFLHPKIKKLVATKVPQTFCVRETQKVNKSDCPIHNFAHKISKRHLQKFVPKKSLLLKHLHLLKTRSRKILRWRSS